MRGGQTFAPDAEAIETIARATIAGLPDAFRRHLGAVVLRIEELADDETLDALGIDDPFQLSGLYRGRPVGDKSIDASGALPDMIHLYRRALLDEWIDGGETLETLVAHVVIHEIGHHFGLSDAGMHALEEARRVSGRIALAQLTCIRSGRLLFESLDLTLRPGEAALIIGPNGVGKSSLLRIAAGLLAPAAGRVVRDGRIALAAEALALDVDRPLAAALGFWAVLDGGGPADVADGLAALDLSALTEVPVRLLSTGQRKRATLARVVAARADIWLLDEPGNGLDVAALDALGAAMAAHRADGGIVLAASHQPIGLTGAREITL